MEIRQGTVKRFFLAMLAALLLVSMFAPPMARPAQAQVVSPPEQGLKPAGPIDPSNGFPFWYQDKNDLRLDLCLDPQDQKCLQPFEMPDPTQPVSFPDNFPGEAFWWAGEAQATTNNGSDALLVMAQEAAFANEVPKDGDQMSFGRVRVRVDGLQIGQKYKVTHPYGTDTFIAEDDGKGVGEINATEDIGCFPTPRTPCNFDQASSSRVGPFLTWDTFGGTNNDPALRGANGEPNAYVGDPNVEHAVKGSPYGTNVFKVERLNADGTVAQQVSNTNQFAVSGKVSSPQVGISPADTLFNADQEITMSSSDPSVQIRYTMSDTEVGPADPTASSDLYSAPITLTADPETSKTYTIKAAPFDSAGNLRGKVVTKSYTIDKTAPHLTADPASKVSEGPLDVTLNTDDPQAKIYYTLDGSTSPTVAIDGADPTASKTFLYNGTPIHVSRSTTIHAMAVDAAGNKSRVETFSYQIASLAQTGPIDPSNGFPSWYEDTKGTRLDLCLDPQDQKCLQPFEMPDPTQPVSFPDNFPGEAFWWAGEAQATTNNGSDALLVMAQEAAFANDQVVDGDQMSFGRVRVRVDGLEAGQTYRVTHPYGVDEFVADPVVDGSTVGEINATEDIGCFPAPGAPCDFDDARFGRVGPFLTWDTFGQGTDTNLQAADGTPDAYVGDPNVEHAVKGSPYGTNVFKVERLNADGTVAQQVANTDQFAVSGKVSNPAPPEPQPQPPTAPTGLALAADSNSGDAADGVTNDTTPTINGTAQAGVNVDILDGNQVVGSGTAGADGSFSITTSVLPEGNHTLTAVAKNGTLSSAPSGSIALTIDTTGPAAPGANPAPGTYNSAQSVTLSAGDAADKIYYTTDGSEPTTNSTAYGSPIAVANTQTIKAIAVDVAGNRGATGTFAYTIELQAATQLNLNATPQSFVFGSAGNVAISGRLTSANAGVSGQQVIVEKRPAGAADWVRVGTAPTQANGSYSLNVARSTVDRNTDFRARFAGSTAQRLQASQSAALRVGVQAQVNLNNVANLRAGQTATLSGSVAPAKPGSVVTVTITGGGQTVTRQATLPANSTYSVTWQTPAARGVTYTAVARIDGDANHEAGQSVARTFRTN